MEPIEINLNVTLKELIGAKDAKFFADSIEQLSNKDLIDLRKWLQEAIDNEELNELGLELKRTMPFEIFMSLKRQS
jgi:hypothetical protein